MSVSNSFLLLIAPPASGKTRLLLTLFNQGGRWIFLSPLRALANEFYISAEKVIPTFLVSNSKNRRAASEFLLHKKHALVITTPELFSEELLVMRPTVVLDEFHLFYTWGQDFRPKLWDSFVDIAVSGVSVLALSGTVSPDIFTAMERDISLGFDENIVVDMGNRRLKYYPSKITWYPEYFKNRLKEKFEYDLSRTDTCILYFCKYRHEVEKQVVKYGGLSCKGGETLRFSEELSNMPNPKCIFATTALSHGVNLPKISKIYFSYKVNNLDFWIQMVGRGGRKGEKYEVHTMDSFFKSKIEMFTSTMEVIVKAIYLKCYYFFYEQARYKD